MASRLLPRIASRGAPEQARRTPAAIAAVRRMPAALARAHRRTVICEVLRYRHARMQASDEIEHRLSWRFGVPVR
jgi:hypothetical protein